ncbi:MAG: hypothetical protein J5966_05695 [Lachnospiraceae bacterium]|nr:hypothetical protein [Lachnospiraceae bacterium]
MFGHSEDNILSRDRSKKNSIVDQAKQASEVGVDTQMDQMLVVAQTMSPRDAKKLSDEGFDMSEMDPADAVNSLDRMKIKLAEAGVNVAGYTDTVSAEKVAEVTGQPVDSAALAPVSPEIKDTEISALTDPDAYFTPDTTEAEIKDTLAAYDLPATKDNTASVKEAVNIAAELQALTDNTRLFLASEGLEPTIDNVFRAEFSSGKAQPGGNSRYIADGTGYVSRAGNLDAAMNAGGRPGTEQTEELDRQISGIIRQSGYEETPEIRMDSYNMINAGVPLTADTLRIYEDSKRIDIHPLKKEVMNAIASGRRGKDAYLIADYKNIKAERVTKEAALSMATEVNRKNLDKDRRIDTGYLEEDVESLKTREREIFDLLDETLSVKADILRSPAELAADREVLDVFAAADQAAGGARISAATELDLRALHEKAADLTDRYERMNQTYEAVGTETRADLGDSIRKAFDNTDFGRVLKELGFEDTSANERAVRIASYSGIELTTENIERISTADDRLSSVLEKLTPPRVLRMIKDNINPLETPLEELDRRLTGYENEEGRPAEDFARYLVSERERGNLTEDEATSYIGIYRFINAINAGDHKAVGMLVASGMEMNFSNLLSAVRTGHKGHVDRYIDNNFNGLDAALSDSNPRIDQMIRASFTPDQSEEEYYEEEARKFAEAAKAEAEIYKALEEAGIPRSASNVTAYEQLMAEGGNKFAGDLRNRTSDRAKERMKRAGDKLGKAMEEQDASEIREAYDEMVKAELIGAFEGETLDIRALQSVDKVLHIKQSLAQADEYNIPAEFDGEIININLKLRHGENRNSVDIYFETYDFGEVHGAFNVDEEVHGAVKSGKAAGDEYMRERLDAMSEAISRVSGKNAYLKIGDMDIPGSQKAMDGGTNDNAMLYRMAKAVLDAVLQ